MFMKHKALTPLLAQEEYFRGAFVPRLPQRQAGVHLANADIGNTTSAGRLVRVMNNGVMDYHLLLKGK